MRFDSCEEILEDFYFLISVIEALPDDKFTYMTKDEIQEEKASWIEEIRMEYAFKLLCRIEAEIRMEFNQSISSKRRDSLSREWAELCDEYRRKTSDYARSRKQVCKSIGLKDILKRLGFFFSKAQDVFHAQCSILKGHLTFRNWYAHGRYFRVCPPVPDPEELIEIYEGFQQKVFNRSCRSISAD